MSHKIYTIKKFEIVAPYTLRLIFDDGVEKTIDLSPVLRGELYGPLRDLEFFNQVKLDRESGTIVWPNEADFDPATLHDWDEVGAEMIEMASKWEEESTTPYAVVSPASNYRAAQVLREAKAKLQAQATNERPNMSLAEVLPSAQQLSRRDKVRLARILLDEVDTEQDIFPLEAGKAYYIATPYNLFGVADILMQTLEADHPLGAVET